MKRGHRPQRTCVGCGQRDDKAALLRFVWRDGELRVDSAQGRGGYLHRRDACWQALIHKKNLYRTFRTQVGREPREKFVRSLGEP